jgi:Ca-activated chloride channel homolog
MAVAAAFAVLLTGVLTLVGRDASVARCLSVSLASSQEKSTLLTQMAADYQRTNPSIDGRCVTINVTRQASGRVEQALARGWNDRIDGPRPDVWSPAALTWATLLSQQLATAGRPNLVPAGVTSLFKSPLVIGMPKPMATALGWPATPLGWSDTLRLARERAGWSAYGHPEWGAFQLGKTNPNLSTSGLHALIGTYFAASSRSADLTESVLTDPAVMDFVRRVESSVVHYGDSISTFLLNLQAADDANAALSYVSAIAMEEKEVWDYNQGNPLGDPGRYGQHLPPRVPLVAIYPKEGTLAADHPYVILNAGWVTAATRAAAETFLRYLQAPAQQQRFQAVGFRDEFGRPGGPISTSNGLQPDGPGAYVQPPSGAIIERMQQEWSRLRKRARILILFDISSSVATANPRTLQASLGAGLTQLAGDDQVGAWEFASSLTGRAPSREVVAEAPLAQTQASLEREVAGLRSTSQPAELYRAILDAVESIRAGADPSLINAVVVVTNGHSTAAGDLNFSELLRQLQLASEGSSVHVFTVAYGTKPDTVGLGLIARASRGATYDANQPSANGGLFTAVISNF